MHDLGDAAANSIIGLGLLIALGATLTIIYFGIKVLSKKKFVRRSDNAVSFSKHLKQSYKK